MVNRRRRGSSGKFFSYSEELKHKSGSSVGVILDAIIDPKEEIRFRKRHTDLIRKLTKEYPFTRDEVESLLVIYYKFQKVNPHNPEGMTKIQFKELLHEAFDLTSREMKNSVGYVLDKSTSKYLSMENWVKAMALFLRGTFEEKVRHCFNVYDMFADGFISKDRMLILLSRAILEEDADDVIKDLIEQITRKLDVDRDGKITYGEFRETIYQQPLLMECLGQCLPTRKAVTTFLMSFTPYMGKL